MPLDIRRALKKFAPNFREARDANMNEADTVLRLCRFFETVLCYDGLTDISREAEMKRKYVDVCLKIDGTVRILVEAKAAGVRLRDRHIEQAQAYASHNNFRWVLLTNGIEWNLYHLTFEEGIDYERAFQVSLGPDDDLDDAAYKLSFLQKTAVRKGELDDYWETISALGPASIGKALFSETVLLPLRREIRRLTGVLIDPEDLVDSVHEMLSVEAREAMGPPKMRKRRKVAKKTGPVTPMLTTAELPTIISAPEARTLA